MDHVLSPRNGGVLEQPDLTSWGSDLIFKFK